MFFLLLYTHKGIVGVKSVIRTVHVSLSNAQNIYMHTANEIHCGKQSCTLSIHYTYLLFSGSVNVVREVVAVEALVCEDLEGFRGDPVVNEEDGRGGGR